MTDELVRRCATTLSDSAQELDALFDSLENALTASSEQPLSVQAAADVAIALSRFVPCTRLDQDAPALQDVLTGMTECVPGRTETRATLLLAQLPARTAEKSSVVEQILSVYIRPIFASAAQLGRVDTESGRAGMAARNSTSSHLWHKQEPTPPWAKRENIGGHTSLGAQNVLAWCASSLVTVSDTSRWESLWFLLVPPIMVLLDAPGAEAKLYGASIVSRLVPQSTSTHIPVSLLQRTGLAQLFQEALERALHHITDSVHGAMLLNAILYARHGLLRLFYHGDVGSTEDAFLAYAHLLSEGVLTPLAYCAPASASTQALVPETTGATLGSARLQQAIAGVATYWSVQLSKEIGTPMLGFWNAWMDWCAQWLDASFAAVSTPFPTRAPQRSIHSVVSEVEGALQNEPRPYATAPQDAWESAGLVLVACIANSVEATMCFVRLAQDATAELDSVSTLQIPAQPPGVERWVDKSEAVNVIFSPHATRPYGDYTPDMIPHLDEKLAIYFERQRDYEDTIALLHFNCPNERCERMSTGWADLKAHAKRDHSRLLCDLCVQHKKIFSHEHVLYTASSLQNHLADEHRYCEYCKQHFYSDDELYVHMRDRHEQCHICKARSDEERYRYYKDYRMLEQHFQNAHYVCSDSRCLEQKFVVFENEMELQVHQVQEHGKTLSSRERRDALRVDTSYLLQDAQPSNPRRRRGKGRADGVSIAESRGQDSSRRAQFGHSLTEADSDAEQETEQYWSTILTVLNGSQMKLAATRSALQSYRASENSVNDLLNTTTSLTGDAHGSFDLGSTDLIIQSMAEIVHNAEKKKELLDTWAACKARQSSHSTQGQARASHTSVRQLKSASAGNNRVWENVARAASNAPSVRSHTHFPTLGQHTPIAPTRAATNLTV
ncbi:hypothetical protein MVES_000632 [Malassezia vespertilionis]|uniref:C2H2-type domain-containing protein n=1 Tax=Malassezia vespertilionis TaxID=2020962 RepID=A0A2N1JGY9_9BASI|nr:hypothetical protein MVES_000632 [Malassezia vespertilionis]